MKKKASLLVIAGVISAQTLIPDMNTFANETEIKTDDSKVEIQENQISKEDKSKDENINNSNKDNVENNEDIKLNIEKSKDNVENKDKKIENTNYNKDKNTDTSKDENKKNEIDMNKEQNKQDKDVKNKEKVIEQNKNSDVVNIPDQNLKKLLNDTLLQSGNSDITKKQLESIISINGEQRNISNLEGLQYCTNLQNLSLMSNNISDITPLKNLSNLNSLALSFNKINNIESLKSLTNLQSLFLMSNNISDITPLKNLNKLKDLYLGDNNIKDIDPLKDLTNLTDLGLYANEIKDIGPLKKLTNLRFLSLHNQKIMANPITLTNGTGKSDNIVKGINNEFIDPNNISNNGVYDKNSNMIEWTNLNMTNEVNYSFENKVTIGNTNCIFSGNVYVKVNEEINEKPAIKAENKTIKVGEKFNPMTGVTANDKEDGNITKDIKVIEDTVNTSKVGTYKVVYEVTDSKGATATKTITVTVISNDKPVISGADNISIKEGTPFNPITGVTATDTEDGNITKDIKVTGIVDTDKPGKYELTYTVTDKDGNTTTVKRTVIVNPKMVAINNIPVIKAENKTIKVGEKFNPMTGVTANDKEDGNITKDIKVIEDTVNTSKPGTYKVVYEVTDSKGATVTKTITVTVISNDKPVISGADNISIKEGTPFNPITGVTATDTEDGNITKDIKVTGTVDTDKPGKYELIYTVTDKDGNTTTVKRIVTVNSKGVVINSIPIIKAENKTIKVGDKFDPMTGVTATDKEDGNITKDIKIIENTVNTSKPGTYKVVYQVTDSKGATATKTITITVINRSIENSTNNNDANVDKPSVNTNNTSINNKPNNGYQNNEIVSKNPLNPKTGDVGFMKYIGIGATAVLGLLANKKKK